MARVLREAHTHAAEHTVKSKQGGKKKRDSDRASMGNKSWGWGQEGKWQHH